MMTLFYGDNACLEGLTEQRSVVKIKEIFGIDILEGLDPEDVAFAKLIFHRRHVYEHKGGEADENTLRIAASLRFDPNKRYTRLKNQHIGSQDWL